MSQKNVSKVLSVGMLTYFRGSDLWVKPADAIQTLAQHGIDARVPDISTTPVKIARAAFAAGGWRRKNMRAEVVDRNPAHITIGLLRRPDVSGSRVDWLQFDTVTWSETLGWTGATTDEGREFYTHGEKWQTYLDYYWVRSTVVFASLAKIGVPMGGGGILYIHTDKVDEFEKLSRWVETVRGAKLYAIKIDATDPESVNAIGSAVKEHALGQVDAVVTRLSEWREKAKGRTATLETLLEELGDVRGRAIALSVALRFSTEEIDAAIAGAESDLRAQLETSKAPKVAPVATETPAPAPVQDPTPVVQVDGILVYSVEELESLGSKDLRKLCHKIGIEGYAKMTDAGRVVALLQAREAAAS